MACEIEFLAVGEGSRAGDAIVVRHGSPESFEVLLIDGGTEDTGDKIVAHLRKYFGPRVFVNDLVLTHADADHASGLRVVLTELRVVRLWMHIPWAFAADARPLFKNKNYTVEGLSKAIRDGYDILSEIVGLAEQQGTEVVAPFAGDRIGPFVVLSPDRQTYVHLLPQFPHTPEPDQALLEGRGIWIGKAAPGVFANFFERARAKVGNWIPETWEGERLRDGGVTSASNESSVVVYGTVDAQRILLTGDAGTRALSWAADAADRIGLPLRNFTFVQIPHHGSRRNVGPTILNRLLGPIQPRETERFRAYVSAPKDDDQHPRRIVLNAFIRRGGKVYATQGQDKIHYGGFPRRSDYVDVYPVGFATQVEDYD